MHCFRMSKWFFALLLFATPAFAQERPTAYEAMRTVGTQLNLKTLAGRWQSQDNDDCWLRGGASAHVNAKHEIELYCHERRAVKFPLENDSFMSFKWGGPKAHAPAAPR